MKTTKRGFVLPLLLVIIALFLAGGGAYVYTQKKSVNPPVAGNLPVATSTASATSQTTSTNSILPPIKNSIAFSAAPESGPASLAVYFVAKSDEKARGVPYSIEYGDGTVAKMNTLCEFGGCSLSQESNHTYLTPGTYTAKLAQNANGINQYLSSVTITVTPSVSVPTVTTNITVTYPNGGENLNVNEQDYLPKGINFVTRWTSNNLTGTTNVYLIRATDGSVCLLGSAPVNQGSFGAVLGASFKCKNTSKLLTSGQYKVRLIADTQSSSSDLGVNDMSDNYFTLNIISGTPITLTTIDICSPLLKDASTLLFVDDNNKTWTVDYRNASFSEYSLTTGKVQGTDGLQKTTLQDWLKSLYRVGQPQAEICGAPGSITITGTLNASGVLVASSIKVNGQ